MKQFLATAEQAVLHVANSNGEQETYKGQIGKHILIGGPNANI